MYIIYTYIYNISPNIYIYFVAVLPHIKSQCRLYYILEDTRYNVAARQSIHCN